VASLRRFEASKFWYACYRVPGVGQRQRSTKQVDRKKAQKIADAWESAARGGKLTEIQARKVLGEIYQLVNEGEQLPVSTARAFFESWAANKKRETAESTGDRYSKVASQFIESLGKRAAIDVSLLSSRDILAFRDDLGKRVSTSTTNQAVKVVRMALKDAVGENLASANAAAAVRPAKSKGARPNARRAFTLGELRRILTCAAGEWRGMILFGLYTGQRLGDVASVTWQNIDLTRGELAFVSQKTGRRMLIPIAAPLHRYLEESDAGEDPKQPLFPLAYATKRVGTLSNQFYEILADAGLVPRRKHVASGKGRANRRAFNELSFHALRHTATSLMKNAGISPAIVQDVIGHDSPAISANYTHIDQAAKRTAVESLPDLT
jgi:integrase